MLIKMLIFCGVSQFIVMHYEKAGTCEYVKMLPWKREACVWLAESVKELC